jgi:hypothetical protein
MVFLIVNHRIIIHQKNLKTMKKYLVITLLLLGLAGTTTSIAQDGPKEQKKERKADKKDIKAKKKAWNGSERKVMKKKQKADKKEDKAELKDDKMK